MPRNGTMITRVGRQGGWRERERESERKKVAKAESEGTREQAGCWIFARVAEGGRTKRWA